MEKINGKRRLTTRQMVYMSMLIALSIVVKSIKIGKMNFGGLPIIFSGYALGPIAGFIVGALVDILGLMVKTSSLGMPNPVFTITSGLTGLIPVVVSTALGDRYPKYSLVKILLGVIIGQLVTSVFLVPFFIDLLYAPGTFYLKMSKALVRQMTQAPIYSIIIKYLLDRTSKLIDYRNLK